MANEGSPPYDHDMADVWFDWFMSPDTPATQTLGWISLCCRSVRCWNRSPSRQTRNCSFARSRQI